MPPPWSYDAKVRSFVRVSAPRLLFDEAPTRFVVMLTGTLGAMVALLLFSPRYLLVVETIYAYCKDTWIVKTKLIKMRWSEVG